MMTSFPVACASLYLMFVRASVTPWDSPTDFSAVLISTRSVLHSSWVISVTFGATWTSTWMEPRGGTA